MAFIKFNVNEVPLEGKNLVEASAGTGKTFSIAILALRLILEKNIPVEKILLVTFTNNAVAELEERIRHFVNEAHDYAVNGKSVNKPIATVVDQAISLVSKDEIEQRLKDAILFLDQLAVMTIHGFCGQTLNDLAFETGQLFKSQVQSSMDEIYEFYLTDFWRTHINTLPDFLFRLLMSRNFSRALLKELLKNFYAGKLFYLFEEGKRYTPDHHIAEDVCIRITQKQEALKASFAKFVDENADDIQVAMEANTFAKRNVDKLKSADDLWDYISTGLKKGTQYFRTIFDAHLVSCIDQYHEQDSELDQYYTQVFNSICCFALQEIPPKVTAHIEKAGIISYDGLIKNLHKAITGPNSALIIKELLSRYDAVFVDEFQDTDKLQYEIFKSAFHRHTILFYIGDPKQSIYAFRQADINTYLSSYQDVDRKYSMNVNFRSSPRLISALNQFFLPEEDFDTFYFPDRDAAIRYVEVEANPAFGDENDLYAGSEKLPPMTIEKALKKDEILQSLTSKILSLLTDKKYKIGSGENARSIKPSDIAVLVMNNEFGKTVKQNLNEKNIPAVVFNDDKIMQSAEASALYHIMRAMLEPVISNINTGLISSITGKTSQEVRLYRKEQLIDLFRNYKGIWDTSGINSAISAFAIDFGLNEYLTDPATPNGLRMITNLNQLKELLNKTEYFQQLNPAELLDWMKQARDLELLSEDEAVIRLENDAESVTIMTVHRAKGLQYNIVFSPQSDFPISKLRDWVDIYDNGRYILIPKNQMTDDALKSYHLQGNQEKRRLLYVTLTRSIYACFLYTSKQNANTSNVTPFIDQVQNNELIRIKEFDESEHTTVPDKYIQAAFRHAVPAVLKHDFHLADPNWRFMSYTALAAKPEYAGIGQDVNPFTTDYDAFIFDSLRKGSITGIMLHEIFEKIKFQQADRYHFVMAESIARYAASQAELYEKNIPHMVEHVLNATIHIQESTFRLCEIDHANRLSELEFDFPVHNFLPERLIQLCKASEVEVSVLGRDALQGMMNGFIDLLFEHGGKYYILDWKSNYLGNTLKDYDPEGMQEVMSRNNYHLQYLIYTVAVCRYLKHRLPHFDYEHHFGGVIYCFIRGMRTNSRNGIYFSRPPEELIRNIDHLMTSPD